MAGGTEKTHNGKLVEGQALATGLDNARARGAREAQRGDAQLRDVEEATGSHCQQCSSSATTGQATHRTSSVTVPTTTIVFGFLPFSGSPSFAMRERLSGGP